MALRFAIPVSCIFCEPLDCVTDAVALLFKLGSRVKPFPRELERVADFRTTFTVALLPELTVIVPRLTVGVVAANCEVPEPSESVVVACDEALTDSITSAVICPIATTCPLHNFDPVIPSVRTSNKITGVIVFMIYVLQSASAIDK